MDDTSLKAMLAPLVAEYRCKPYSFWLASLDDSEPIIHSLTAAGGSDCTVEINTCWDDQAHRHIRVFLSIASGFWRSICPITDSFIVAPDGSFVGE